MTIKGKIVSVSAFVFGVMLISFALIIYNSTQSALVERLDATLERFAARLQAELSEPDTTKNESVAAELYAVNLKGYNEIRFQLFSLDGRVLVLDSVLCKVPSPNFHEVISNEAIAKTMSVGHEEYRSLWIPLEVDDRAVYIAQVAAPTIDVQAALSRLRLLMLIAIPFALVLTALAAFGITRAAFRPMRAMARDANQITASNLHHQLDLPKAKDEVRIFGEAFNGLLSRLEASFKSQKQFVADASHELRTPLTVLQSELEFVLRQSDSATVREGLQNSLLEIERLGKLTEGLLLLARLDAAQLQVERANVRLDELCLESIQMMRREADSKNVRLDVFIQEPVEVTADRSKLKSALLNLLDNAIKYSNSNDVVHISLRHDSAKVTIAVEDHGVGIAEFDLPKIFDRFYRGKTSRPSVEGNGLGLAIARSLVELHGGTLTASSVVGKGSTFAISLPCTENG